MNEPAATPGEYFDQAWDHDDDPWDHAGRFYETRKYDATVALLDRPRFRRAFEPGCGTGLLTRRLADRCDVVEARDRHWRAVKVTRELCADKPGVNVDVGALPDAWPPGTFDLIVMSEVLYYLPLVVVHDVIQQAAQVAEPDALLVLVHYRPIVAEHVISGDAVNDAVDYSARWSVIGSYADANFRLDLALRR